MEEIKDFGKLVRRLNKALKNKELIILYGDSDMDGAVAVIILKQIIDNLGGRSPIIYFSDRKRTEQGINFESLEFLKDKAPALIVSLDCGTSNVKEIEAAKKLGFEVVVVDHHDIFEIPDIKILVNPKQQSKDSPFYYLAAAGLALKIAEKMLAKRFSGVLKEDILGLAALATLIDLVPEIGENIKILREGLPMLENSWRPGVKAFFTSEVTNRCISTREIAAKIGRITNITDKEDDYLNKIYVLLNSKSEEEANLRLEELLKMASDRQEKIAFFMEELKAKINPKINELSIIFEDLTGCPFPILSVVASRTSASFMKPTFIFTKEKKENWGSYRMPLGENGINAISSCAKFLRRYGGHPAVGGFYFEDKNKEKIKECLIKYFSDQNKSTKKSA
ncbi:DHH family phosphoesterase [Candidatus Parcubacteria bacterium]|nr:DHH family phosphoesterase [Patescibacteria group bacterium]MBU4466947.1 DHH family phosphoesterase [Patescibacteria group bacterium]MCG2688522.1 DHH family phosphoesterase [Candidatus Parcubacteria bacterium]